MRPVALGRALDADTIDTLSLLVDLPPDHVAAVWEQVRKHRAYRELWIRRARWRLVHVPGELLAEFQRRILHRILYTGPVSPAAFAGVPGRSVAEAARLHLRGAGEVLTLDLENAYGSTPYRRIASALRRRLKPELRIMGLDGDARAKAAGTLAHLVSVPAPRGNGRVLPLGAPTSLAIFNLVCLRLDRDALALLPARGPGGDFAYTRYVDDMVFSSDGPLPRGFEASVREIVARSGYRLNEAKCHRQSASGAAVYGLRRGPGGVEPTPASCGRYANAIRERFAAFDDPEASDEDRAHALAGLRGIDGWLSQFYERAGVPRPPELRFPIPDVPNLPRVAHPDELWR